MSTRPSAPSARALSGGDEGSRAAERAQARIARGELAARPRADVVGRMLEGLPGLCERVAVWDVSSPWIWELPGRAALTYAIGFQTRDQPR